MFILGTTLRPTPEVLTARELEQWRVEIVEAIATLRWLAVTTSV